MVVNDPFFWALISMFGLVAACSVVGARLYYSWITHIIHSTKSGKIMKGVMYVNRLD